VKHSSLWSFLSPLVNEPKAAGAGECLLECSDGHPPTWLNDAMRGAVGCELELGRDGGSREKPVTQSKYLMLVIFTARRRVQVSQTFGQKKIGEIDHPGSHRHALP
jgi:hypothetical protein